MDINGIIESFPLPEAAVADLSRKGLKESQIGDGVTRYLAGHDGGIPYRFFKMPIYNRIKSELAGYEVFDEIEMIEFYVDKKNIDHVRVKELPPELLSFNKLTGEPQGRYAADYKRFCEGKTVVGTSLKRWGILSDSHVASLEADRVYTVEQFAALPKNAVASRYPHEFVEAHERAVQFLASREYREQDGKALDALVQMKRENTKQATALQEQAALIAKLQEQISALSQGLEKATQPKRRSGAN